MQVGFNIRDGKSIITAGAGPFGVNRKPRTAGWRYMDIGLAKEEDVSSIVQLLNEVTLELLSKKVMQWDYPWDRNTINSDVSHGCQYIVKENNMIIAVFSLKDMPVNDWTSEEEEGRMYLYRIAVEPEFQGKNVGSYICGWVQSFAGQNHKTVYLDCWAGNDKLKDFYSSTGFYYIGDFPEEDYMVSVFRQISS